METPSSIARRRHLFAGFLTAWLLLSPTGFVGAAISPSPLTIQGSALAAGRNLSIQTTGDVQLLAAVSQRRESVQSTNQSRRKLETLNFELEQNRVLLSTLSAGHGIELKIGGDLAAQTGTRDANGVLQAEHMA